MSTFFTSMRSLRRLTLAGLMSLAVAPVSFAAGVDSAMITSVQGKVTVGNQPATSFAKVQQGQEINLAQGAKLQLVYFSSSNRETWNGAATFKVGGEGSAKSVGQPAEVSKVPAALTNQLLNSASGEGSSRVGMVRLRSNPLKVDEINRNYQSFKQAVGADSLMPEAYALSAFIDADEIAAAENLLGSIKAGKAQDENARALAKKYEALIATARNTASK